MNRIQLLIFNEQVYSLLLNDSQSANFLFSEQERLKKFSCEVINEVDKKNEQSDKDLISVEKKFDEFKQIGLPYYEKLTESCESILENLENNLLSKATSRRIPMLLKSLFITYVVVSKFEQEDRRLVLINEILEISKLYLEEKFVKMLNKLIDDYGNKIS